MREEKAGAYGARQDGYRLGQLTNFTRQIQGLFEERWKWHITNERNTTLEGFFYKFFSEIGLPPQLHEAAWDLLHKKALAYAPKLGDKPFEGYLLPRHYYSAMMALAGTYAEWILNARKHKLQTRYKTPDLEAFYEKHRFVLKRLCVLATLYKMFGDYRREAYITAYKCHAATIARQLEKASGPMDAATRRGYMLALLGMAKEEILATHQRPIDR